jgi:carnitine O-acetyltransferase
VSAESDRWVAAMDDVRVGVQERRELFALAARKHIERARLAGNGQGVDRHLLGLRSLVRDSEEVPALYADPLFVRSKNWVLSTSALNSQYCLGYGWGEVVPEGFGIAYLTCYDGQCLSERVICARAEYRAQTASSST